MANDKERELVYPFDDTLPAMGATLVFQQKLTGASPGTVAGP